MGKFKFAKSSIKHLKGVDSRLSAIMYQAKDDSGIDFDVSCGNRSIEEQQKLFKLGRSQLDGVTYKSKHNFLPSLAVDIYAYNGQHADYSEEKMYYLAGVIKNAADDLGVKIIWGGDWTIEKDGIHDEPHYELV